MKRIILLVVILCIGLIGLSSCTTAGSEGVMAGNWTLDSTQVTAGTGGTPRELGDGTLTLSYIGKVTFIWVFELYSGTGNIGGVDYLVQASYSPDLQQAGIQLYETGEDPDTDCVDLQDISYTGGDNLDGDYSGLGSIYSSSGAKDVGDGTFVATRS